MCTTSVTPLPSSFRLRRLKRHMHTLQLAERYALTIYDACYLELAQRKALPLATLDTALRKAATAAGVSLL